MGRTRQTNYHYLLPKIKIYSRTTRQGLRRKCQSRGETRILRRVFSQNLILNSLKNINLLFTKLYLVFNDTGIDCINKTS
jgi:hypothetical protein